MREFSVPPVAMISDAANLTDPVWDNAEVAPDAVQFSVLRPGAGRQDVTCAEFRDQVVTLAGGLIRAGVAPGARVGLMSRTPVSISGDGEILVKGDLVFRGYWHDPDSTAEAIDDRGWFHSGDLGELDDDGFLSVTGRKKEIIVTAGGKNVAPAGLEDRLRAHPLISQCVLVGDRQPFIAALVTIDAEAWPTWLAAHGKPAGTPIAGLRTDPALRLEIQQAIDEANLAVSRAESIKVFRILPDDFTESNGLLTPSLKVKRSLVMKEYADELAAIYTR